MNHRKDSGTGFQLWGWLLFVACALCFIASAMKHRDPLVLAGSLIFLAACVLFIIPLVRRKKSRERADSDQPTEPPAFFDNERK